MKRTGCELEESVLTALASDGISGRVREHLRECTSCRDVVVADGWMKSYAARDIDQAALPDPALIWVTHDVMRTTSRFSAFTRTAGRFESLGVSMLALGWALLFAWKWDAFAMLLQVQPASEMLFSILNAQLLTLPFIATLTALVCGSLVMSFRGVLIDGY